MREAILIISLILFSSCAKDQCRESVSPLEVDIKLDRLEEQLFSSSTSKEVEMLLAKNPKFARYFLDADQYPSDSILANQIFKLVKNKAIDTLYQESREAFSEIDEFIADLENAFGRLSVYFPETEIPKIQTVVTGLYKDLFISNDQIVIGMDFFIGKSASFKPKQIPNYILSRYTVQHLPSTIMQFVSSQFIATSIEESMLAEMIDYGKSYYLLSKIMPCTPENILIGYTEDEMNDSFANEEIIWANFVENKLIYDTNHQMKQKFLGERPNVYEIGDKCPGRIGRWVGWQIVKAYADKADVEVVDLMRETDANKIFRMSGYKPSGS